LAGLKSRLAIYSHDGLNITRDEVEALIEIAEVADRVAGHLTLDAEFSMDEAEQYELLDLEAVLGVLK